MVGVETLQDMKNRPFKTTIYLGLLGGIAYLGKTNPSELDFQEQLVHNCNELLQVGDPIRNPNSDSHMQKLLQHYNAGLMRKLNLGICSIMWMDNYEKGTDLYDAQCKSLKVGWMDMKDRTVDVGILGKWWWIEKAMLDYDINPNEWPEEDSNKKTLQ